MITYKDEMLMHHGIPGMRWGVRRYQNPDGTLTAAGKKRYGATDKKFTKSAVRDINRAYGNLHIAYTRAKKSNNFEGYKNAEDERDRMFSFIKEQAIERMPKETVKELAAKDRDKERLRAEVEKLVREKATFPYNKEGTYREEDIGAAVRETFSKSDIGLSDRDYRKYASLQKQYDNVARQKYELVEQELQKYRSKKLNRFLVPSLAFGTTKDLIKKG